MVSIASVQVCSGLSKTTKLLQKYFVSSEMPLLKLQSQENQYSSTANTNALIQYLDRFDMKSSNMELCLFYTHLLPVVKTIVEINVKKKKVFF